ncbi:Card1-like endonuclease domain-containing protein [Caviibacterium pharyngocola]|uniref:DUF1887 domain-containing protein n=1 Tax=Caviibacterium pharyngocola TaxID=28159 RepID=A0A2M8RU45_9PAST|nr:DUF1887 family CARF protein [Caviibacterium pharyngocola]PJG82413.1 DUF1887 domain-containing protein [Caviibacterium pharyngocola]
MQKYDIHFCLISGQAAPNLLPVLDTTFKPQEAVFIVSKTMKNKAEFLANTFKNLHIKVTIEEVADEFNFGEMEDQFLDLINRYEDKNVAANVTGGTKLMSIALANAFTFAGKPIFYVDTDQENRIIFITKDENKAWLPNQPLNAINNVKTYLSAYGATVLNQGDPQENIKLLPAIDPFIQNYANYTNLVPMLNNHASISRDNGYKSQFDKKEKRPKTKEMDNLFLGLDYQKLIEYDGETVNFKNRKIQEFLSGGWLEDYTYHQIKNIKSIEDILLNADVANFRYRSDKSGYANENKGHKNEFDIVFMAKNKLHIIECKTEKMEKKAEDILYKLETLKDYGGLFTKKCLVSYFEVSDAVKNRAKFLNIEIIQATDLKRLPTKVQEWIARKW